MERLRRIGADADEVQTVIERWDDFDEDWTPERRDELLSWSDDQLRAALTDTRDEFAEVSDGTEQADRDRAVQLDNALAEARDIVGLAVPKLLDWVGDDPVRAEAMLSVENEATDPRKTLVEPLEQLVRPVASEGDGADS